MENINRDFEFAQKDAKITDLKFDTKPIGYFKDAWIRFRKSRAAIAGAIVIILIVLYAIIMPLVSSHGVDTTDGVYQYKRPFDANLASIGLVKGTYTKHCNDRAYLHLQMIGAAYEDYNGESINAEKAINSEFNPIRGESEPYLVNGVRYRDCEVQDYYESGFRYYQITVDDYEALRSYEAKTGLRLLYPMVDTTLVESAMNTNDANYWYLTKSGYPVDQNGNAIREAKDLGKAQDIYLRDADGNVQFYQIVASNSVKVRIFYWNYYFYKTGHIPSFLMGSDDQGRDIAVRLASGIGLSLILAVSTFAINFVLGAIYGSIEGYFGGWADLIMERITDILVDIPFIILASIVKLRFIDTNQMSPMMALIFAFVVTGWIGPAYRVRTQFYRFKNQEYVLAARTLGAGNARIMYKHIFPNTLGTIITASVLTIPGTIFSESMLSYLNIVSLNSGDITSLGTLLSTGQQYMVSFPHMILPPAIVISLLMISFNLFGNGLRDAFNPSLRGAEE